MGNDNPGTGSSMPGSYLPNVFRSTYTCAVKLIDPSVPAASYKARFMEKSIWFPQYVTWVDSMVAGGGATILSMQPRAVLNTTIYSSEGLTGSRTVGSDREGYSVKE